MASDVPAKFKVVGQKPVWQPLLVTSELVGIRAVPVFHIVKWCADILRLDIAEWNGLHADIKVRRAARN